LRHVYALMALILLVASTAASQPRYSKVRIPLSSTLDLRQLGSLGIAVEEGVGRRGLWIDLFLSERELERLRTHGIGYTTIIQDWRAYYAEQRLTEQMRAHPADAGHFHLGTMGGCLTFSQVEAELDSMAALYPALVTAKSSIGSSIEGRPLWCVKISKNPAAAENEPRVLYTGLHHAREGGGMMVLLYYMWYLLEHYGADPEVTSLLDTRELTFVPVVNPDGYVCNESTDPDGGGMWRKNRRVSSDGVIGVDLNRNYGFEWGYNDFGSSGLTGDETYRGTSPFSEPETQAVAALCDSIHPSTAYNYHMYSDLVIYPWGYLDSDTRDSLTYRSLGEILTSVNRYTYGTGGQTVGYVTNGDSDDWMYGDTLAKPKIFSMTPEVGAEMDGFWPPSYRVAEIAHENLAANLALAHAAGAWIRVGNVEVDSPWGTDSTALAIPFVSKGVAVPPPTMSVRLTVPGFPGVDTTMADYAWHDTLRVRFRIPQSVVNGQRVTAVVAMDYAGGASTDTISFLAGHYRTVFTDDAESTLAKWVVASNQATVQWDTTSVRAHGGQHAFCQSHNGTYTDHLANAMTFKSPLPLLGDAAELRFWTMWNIETNYDYAQVLISTDNGAHWTALQGKYTSQGSGAQEQVFGAPGYDGIKHAWVQEVIDLSYFMGQNILLRFAFNSDSWVTLDGIFVDDIEVRLYPFIDSAPAESQPSAFSLAQNFPNPFNPSTTIRYVVPARGHVTLTLFDMLGREVKTLVNTTQEAGTHDVVVDASGMASGAYVYRLTVGGARQARMMMLLR
jgi:carboxypeptidase T